VIQPKMSGNLSRDLLSLQEPIGLRRSLSRGAHQFALSLAGQPAADRGYNEPGPQEGKSLTAINLAVTMALTGNRVLLVDADMRSLGCTRSSVSK